MKKTYFKRKVFPAFLWALMVNFWETMPQLHKGEQSKLLNTAYMITVWAWTSKVLNTLQYSGIESIGILIQLIE